MKQLLTAAIMIGLVVYLAAFYMTPLPELHNDAGQPQWRIHLLWLLLSLPDEWLFSCWFGAPLQFSLADRLPVLLTAGAILTWAGVLGWLLIIFLRRLCGVDASPAPVRRLCGEGVPPAMVPAGGTPGPQLRLTRLETSVFSLAVGLSAVSTWTLFLGLFGVLERTWVFEAPALATLLTAAGVCYLRMKQWLNSRRLADAGLTSNSQGLTASRGLINSRGLTAPGLPSQHPGHSNDVLSAYWLWLAAPFVLAILLAAMLPPTDFDVCEYHLQAPKEFLQRGKIAFLPHNVYANMPLGTEMLSLLAMVVAGDWWLGALAGKTVIAAFTPLCALGLYAAGRRFYSTAAGVAAALLYISIPWVAGTSIIPSAINVSTSGLVEGALACYLFLAVYALMLAKWGRLATATWDRLATCPTIYLVLAGYLAGAAAATKYPAVLFVLLPLAAWTFFGRLWAGMGDQGSGVRVQDWKAASIRELNSESETPNPEPRTLNPLLPAVVALIVFLLAAAAGCGLWFGKNWVQSGNPTYPLLYGVFDGKTWNADKDQRWNRVHRPDNFSAETLGKDLGRVLLTSEWLSPLVVPLALLAFVGWGRHARFFQADRNVCPTDHIACSPRWLAWKLSLYVAFVIAVWWLFTHRIDRFWIPVLPLLALLAGAGACWSSDRPWRWFLKGLLLAGLAANFLVAAAGPGNAWFVPLEQLRNDPRWTTSCHRYLNDDRVGGAVLLVGDAEVFDLKPHIFYNTCFDDCVFEQLVKGKTAQEVRAELATRYITHILVNWGEISRYIHTYGFTHFVQPEVFDKLVEEGVLAPVPSGSGYPEQVYRVLPAHGG